MQRNYAIA